MAAPPNPARDTDTGSALVLAPGFQLFEYRIDAVLAALPAIILSRFVWTERPELFGRAMVIVGLAEGIAIYGLIVSVILIGKA